MTEDFEKILKEIYEPVLRKNILETFGGFKEFTTEQQAQYDKWVAERKDWEEKFQRAYELMSVENPVLQLHKKDGSYCEGCDYGGYEGEPPEWPCRTVLLIITGDANFHFEPLTPFPRTEFVHPTRTNKYTILH